MAEPLLALQDLRAGYGDSVILDGVSLEVPEHGSLAVLGRNGVGKSTLLLTVMVYTRLHSGKILWKGEDVTTLAPHRRALLGLGWVPQEREIFPSLTLEENLTVAARPGRWDLAAVYRLFPRLQERKANLGNQLSGGEQQMLAIARALMSEPKLLLLDEPSMGLAPRMVAKIFEIIAQIARAGVTILLVEQNALLALETASRGYVMESGEITLAGSAKSLLSDSRVREAYLGETSG